MNKWRIYVAGITIETQGGGEYETLRKTGLFSSIEQTAYFQTFNSDNLWIYRVEINGKPEIAVIKRIENEGNEKDMIERKIMQTFGKVIPKLTSSQKNYLLGLGEGMDIEIKLLEQKSAKLAAGQESASAAE